MSVLRRLSIAFQGSDAERQEAMSTVEIEVAGVRLAKTEQCPKNAWVSISMFSSKASEAIITDKVANMSTVEKEYVDLGDTFSNRWWLYHESFRVQKDHKLFIEFLGSSKEQKEHSIGQLFIAVSSLTEDFCEYELTGENEATTQKCYISLRISSAQPVSALIPAATTATASITPSAPSPLPPAIGTLRATVWQGKSINTSYPIFLSIYMPIANTPVYHTATINNSHNPMFDYITLLNLYSLQGDVIFLVYENHQVRSIKPLGQVIVPVSTLVQSINPLTDATTASLTSWFEIFPYNRSFKHNRGGQYRPYTSGMSPAVGYGLHKPEKTVGFLKIELELSLHMPIGKTLVRYPFCHEPLPVCQFEEDESSIATVLITKHNLTRIIQAIKNPPYLRTFLDIIHWKTNPLYTFCALYLHSYMFLLAPVWQYPILFVIGLALLGYVASMKRNYDIQLYVAESHPEEESKSITEKYKQLKQAAISMELLVDDFASMIEKGNNIITWADPYITGGAVAVMMIVSFAASAFLVFVPPHKFTFLVGLGLFTPKAMISLIKTILKSYASMGKDGASLLLSFVKKPKPQEHKITTLLKKVDYESLIDGNEQKLSGAEPVLKGHELSGFLYSKNWDNAAHSTAKHGWTVKWCELWRHPPLLKITTSLPAAAGNTRREEFYEYFNIKLVTASLVQKIVLEGRKRGNSGDDGNRRRTSSWQAESSATPESKRRGASLDNKSSPDEPKETLYCFEVKAYGHKQGWVFGCKSRVEAESWVGAIGSISVLSQNDDGEVTVHEDNNVEEESILDEDVSLKQYMEKLALRWMRMTPDDLELQHRYICSIARIPQGFEASRLPVKHITAETTRTTMTRPASSGRRASTAPNASSPAEVRSFVVTVLSLRNMPVKEATNNKLLGALTSVLPKLFVHLSISPSLVCSSMFKSGGQPRGATAIYREEFTFDDIIVSEAVQENARLILSVMLNTPLALGSDSEKCLGVADVALSYIFAHVGAGSYTNAEWFNLFDRETGLALSSGAAIQLQFKVV